MKALSYFYLCLSFLSILPVFIFSTQLVIFGRIITASVANLFHLFFAALFALLYLVISKAKKFGLGMAILLHLAFLVNNLLMVIGKTPLLEIKGLTVTDSPYESGVIWLSLSLNLLILTYLIFQKSHYRLPKPAG